MFSNYFSLSDAYGPCYSQSFEVIGDIQEDFKDVFGGYSSLGVRRTGGDFSGLRSFGPPAIPRPLGPPAIPRPPGPPGPPEPRPPPPPGHPRPRPHRPRPPFYYDIPIYSYPDWYGPFYRNYYYPYFYHSVVPNRLTFFDSINDIK